MYNLSFIVQKRVVRNENIQSNRKFLLTAYCLLPTFAFCLLLTVYCLLPTVGFAAISTVDSQGGAYSSVKLQSNGKPAIAYFDHATGELRYSYWTTNGSINQWIRGVVEEKGVTGYVSLSLDGSNRPYISYYHNISKNNSTGSEQGGKYGNHMVGALKYAYCPTTTCLTPEDWTKVTVAQIGQSENGHTGGFSSLAFDSSGNPRIAYYDFSDSTGTKKGALKLAYCNSGCNSTANWTISTVDTDGGRSASMVIYSDKVMLSYDADEIQKIRYAESSPPFSLWSKVDIDTVVNTTNLWRDTSIAFHPTTGKPRLVYQYQGENNYGTGGTYRGFNYGYNTPGIITRRDAYYAYCDAADCTVSVNWTKNIVLETNARYLRGYTSSIKVGSDGKPRIAYHYWGHRASAAYSIGLAHDLKYVLCGNSACSSGNNISTIDSTNNTGIYSSIVLDSSNNPLISYYDYDSNLLKLYHPTNSYSDAGITADARASDSSNGGTGIQSGDTFTILFSGATNGSGCSITTANIDTILKLSNGHSWKCDGSSITAQWSTTYNTNDTLTITVTSGTGGCVPTVEVGDRVSLDGTCILDGSGNPIILQTELKGSTGVKVQSGTVAYYKMDEGSKFTAYDSAGGHHASLNKGVAWTTGISSYGVSLDGSNDHLFAPTLPDINGGKLTIEAWLKPNAFGTGYTILGKESSYVMASNGQCAIATTGTGWAWYGEGSMSRLQRNYSGNKDIWRQVVCTYDGTTQKVYIDGILDGSRSATGNVSGSRYPFVMGRRELSTGLNNRYGGTSGACGDWEDSYCGGDNYWGTNYYNGKMDEVVIYNIALSQTEIENRFRQLPAQLERADAHDTSGSGYGLQAGDTIKIRFTNETNAPAITKDNINTVLAVSGKTWLDGSNNIGSAAWSQTRFPNDTLIITLSTTGGSPSIITGDIITLGGGVIKEKTGTNSITGSTKIRGSYDLNGAVAYWNFNESSGDPSDSVGQYNNGTLKYTTTASTYSAGKYNNAINFDGGTNSQYVEVSNYPDLNPSNITIEGWVYIPSDPSSNDAGQIVEKGGNSGYRIRINTDRSITFFDRGGTNSLSTAAGVVPLSTWTHIAVTGDSGGLKIYVNGILSNSNTTAYGGPNTTSQLTIGYSTFGPSYFNGSIDELVIYNRAITPDEVRKRSSSRFKTAVAKDASGGGIGIQSGDTVVITFDAPTAGTAIGTISSSLALSGGHSWGTIQSAVWSTTTYTNDTLTITLGTGATVEVGDTITLGTTLKDTFNRALTGSIVIGGNFGVNLPANGIAYYNFDEQGGTTAHDSIGNNHGTLIDSTFWRTEGQFKGLYFDGSRYVDVPDSPDFNLSSYTLDAWVKVPDGLTTGVRRIISQDDGTNYWKLQLNNNNLELCDSRLSTLCNNTVTTINDGEWHHLIAISDSTNSKVLLYIDGVLTEFTGITGGGTPHNISANIQIGRKYDGTEYFYGMVDELAVYNRVLTDVEVKSRYRAPVKSAFTSDIYFNSGIQSGDKVIIRFHGKTNGYTVTSGNIGTVLPLSSGSWGTVQSAVWSSYKFTNDTLTVTLGSGATIASGATITINRTNIKDVFNNTISNDSIVLSKDFDFNLPEGDAGYWKLDETSGTTAYDSFGTNNGTLYNSPTWTAGKFNNALSFNGSNNYIQNSSSFPFVFSSFTMEAWVKTSGGGTIFALGGDTSGNKGQPFIGISGGKVYGRIQQDSSTSGFGDIISVENYNDNQWHHIALTYDGATKQGILYVDGASVGTLTTTSQLTLTTSYFRIGTGLGNAFSYFSGLIDDVAVYTRALSAGEVLGRYGDYTIKALAMDTLNGLPGIQAGDTVQIKFSGPTNAAFIDETNIDNALALSNAHTWRRTTSPKIVSAVWSTRNYSNDTLTVTLQSPDPNYPDVAPGDTITIGSPIGSQYRAFTKSGTIAGSFGNNLPSVMAAFWTFDEQNGATAYDSIGENHGTLNNSFWRTDRIFKGLYFDGSRYITVPDSNDFNLSSYTIDAWVKVPDGLTTGIRNIISQDDGTNYWRMRLNDNRLEICDSRLTTLCNNTASTVNDGEWHHIAVVRDDAADKVLFYLDGVNILTVSSLTETGTHTINANIQIGRKYDGTEYFYGMIDEIAVYNRVLTTSEVQSRYRAPLKSARTSDSYFSSGIQSGKDKVVIRFHGKTNGYAVNSGNIGTVLPLSGGHTWGTIQSAAWSTYKWTNDTLTVTLGTGATIAKGDTITITGAYIKDLYGNEMSDSITLGGDFAINLPEGAVSYWTLDSGTAGDTLVQNSISSYGSPSSSSLTVPVFSYDFTGTTISNLTYGGTSSGWISQNNNLSIRNNGNAWDTYVYTNTTFARSSTKAFQAKFRANSGVRALIGWYGSTINIDSNMYAEMLYGIYFNNGTFNIIEDNNNRGSVGSYDVNAWYDVRIELKATGAKYYYKPTTSQTWTLLYDSNYSSESNIRPGILHYDYNKYSYTDDWIVEGDTTVTCKFSGCYSFGSDQYTYASNSRSLNPERISIETWVKNSYGSTWTGDSYFFYGDSSAQFYGTDGARTVNFRVYVNGGWRTVSYTPSDITVWHHYVGTYDGTNLKLYMDGVLVGTTAYAGVINQFDTGTFYIGAPGTGYTPYISIDDMTIYNRALTLEEVIGRYGEYATSPFYFTAFANDPAPDVSGIQAGDTVEIRFPGPTNGILIDASNIDAVLTLSSLHTWLDGSSQITSAVWSTRVYENDTLTITLSATTSAPDVAPQDTISMGGAGEIGAKYRAATWSAKISGTFGEVLPGTPVAFYKMDENIGTIAFDSVGTNDGTLTNSPSWGTGFFNYGLEFNSSTAYLDVGSITLSGDWSVEGWFKYPLPSTATYNSLTGDRRVVVQRTDMHLGTHNGTNFVDLGTPYVMSGLTSGWHHIAAVGSGSTTKFYIDGVLVGTANYKTTAALTTVGNTTAGSEQFGFIDELAVYSSALSDSDVAARYLVFFKEIYAKDTTRGGAGIQNGDQVIVRFDGPTGATAINSGNIDNALQLSGGHVWGNITSAVWSTVYKQDDTLTITLDAATATVAMRDTITLGTIIKDAYNKDITGSMQIGGDFGTNLPDGAVGYWKFNETSGITASDSFNDNDGTLTNSPTWATGRFNNGLNFTGGTGADADYVAVNNAAVLNPGKLTVEAWAKSGAAAWNANGTIVSKRDAYILYPVSGGKNMQFYVYAGGAWRNVLFTADGGFDITKWHHYVGTYDGTNLKIYVDGALKNTTAYTGTVNTTDTGNLFIGRDDGTANYLNGDIDEVVLYNTALSLTDIQNRYGAWFSSATADDNSNKGPNIQANDRVIITFTGETNGPTIDANNINTVLSVSGKTWKDGAGAIVSAAWTTTTYTNDTLTITLSGPATYTDTTPAKPTIIVGDTISINGTITDSSGRVIRDTMAISGSFGVSSTAIPSSAAADDNSGKGPNIQANDRVVITFANSTNAPVIDANNINTILSVTGKTWRDGNNAIVSAVWSQTTNPNDTLTVTLSGPATYLDTTPTKPTVVVGDTITIDGTITDSSGKAIVSTVAISGSFGVTAATISSAAADDNSGKGPNIQANDRVVITFSGSTDATTINSGNINTILPVTGKPNAWLDGNNTIVNAGWSTTTNTNDTLTITLSGPATYTDTTPTKPTVVVGDTITINGTINNPSGKAIVTTANITGSFGVTAATISSAAADDNSGKGPNIQANDRVVITFSGSTDATTINSGNINAVLPVAGKTWLDGNNAIVSAVWSTTTNTNDTLTITLSGPATYADSTPTKPTVIVGDTITIDGTINNPSGQAIVSSIAITGSFGTASSVVPNTAVADDNSGKGPNIQANDRVVITFSGSTNAPTINSGNINTILLVSGKTWLDGDGAIVSAVWSQTTVANDTLTITLSGPATYADSTPTKPTVIVGDTITIDGTIADASGKAIISSKAITGSFGTASSVTLSSAAADDNSNWGPNIQANDRVVITFSGSTNAPTINSGNINTILLVSGKTWLDGDGAIVSAVWSQTTVANDTLTITLSGPATQQDTTPARPTVAVGDTIIIDGTMADTSSNLIISSIAISGSYGTASGTVMQTAFAFDDSGQYKIQAGDKIKITFNGQIGYTGDTPPTINATNIDTALSLNNGHSWKDGSGAIGSAVWSTTTFANDTLTITLSDNTSAPTIAIGDTITLGGSVIKDKYRIPINSSLAITGDLGKPSSAKAEWKFNEGSGTSITDSVGSYGGTITGSGYWMSNGGRFSHGLKFDANSEYITLTTQYNLTSSWTIEAWFKYPMTPLSGQQKYTLIASNSASNEDQIIIEDQTKYIGTSSGNNYYYVPNYNLSNLTAGWHHVAAVGEGGSGTGGTTKFYIDGVYVGTASYKSQSNIKYIGNSYVSASYNRPMRNTIDHIVVYNTALSATTIKNRYGSWPRSAYAYGSAGDYVGIDAGDKVVLRFDQATEGNTINASNIDTALQLSGGHTWKDVSGAIGSAVWSTTIYSNDTLTITLSTTSGSPTVAKNDTITFNNVIKDSAGRPIYDTITLQGSFDFKLPIGAIAYWRFNEGSGTTVSDSFGNNHATASQNYLWDNGMYGTKGVLIDASNEAVPLDSPLNMPTEWTIIGWLKTPVYGTQDNALIHSSSDHEHAICIHTGTGNAEVGNVSPTTDPGGSLERGTGYFLNRSLKNGWHQIAAVGTGGNGTAGTTKYYVDGQQVGSIIGYKAYTPIGALGNNTGAGLHAIGTTIDEISVYDRPLTATEISQHYGARLKSARAKDASGLKFGINAGDQVVLKFDGETSVTTPITVSNIDTVLQLSNGHTWKDGNGQIGSIAWSTTTYTNDTLTITLSTNLIPPTVSTRDTITLDGVTIKDLNRVITGSIDIAGDFDGSAAYYDLDEGAAITAEDSVNNNNGTLTGQGSTLPTWVTGYSGTALDFNDTNTQYVTVPDSSSFNLTSYTMEAWIKLPPTIPSTNYMRIVSQESNTNPTNYWSLAINPRGQLVHCDSNSSLTAPVDITVANSTTTSGSATITTTNNFITAGVKAGLLVTGTGIDTDTYVKQVNSATQITLSKNATANGTVQLTFTTDYNMGGLPIGQYPKCETVDTIDLRDNKWHFVAVVRDTITGNFKFFIDHGNCTPDCVPNKTIAGSAGAAAHNITGTIEIGRKNGWTGCDPGTENCSQEYFRGSIDNVAIYNYALTDAEVNIHHFLYPSEAWASDTSGLGANIQAGDTITILFNGETAATTINSGNIANALKLPTGKTWGTFNSAVWSTTYYPNDTLTITLNADANMAIGDIITLGNTILDVHSNPISGSVAITGSFEVNVPIGAIAYWDFNEGVNSSIADKVGSYSGSLNATPTTEWITGKFSYGLDFTGKTNYVNLPSYVPLSSNAWTIEAWFYAPLAATADNKNVMIMYDNATAQIAVMDVSGTRYLGTYYSGAGGGFYSSGYNVANLTTGWHHLVAVGMNNQTKFYIDGTLVGTSGYQSNISIRRIGNGYNASAEFKRPWGKIDDVVIYKRALSTTEISARAAR